MRQREKLLSMVAQTAVCRHLPRSSILISRVITLLLLPLPLGLLVSACVNRAPEGLLGAAVADVGVHDLLKVTAPPIFVSPSNVHCLFPGSSRTSPSDAHGPLTMATRMIPTTLTSFIQSHRCTTCQPTKFFLQHYFLQLIVRDFHSRWANYANQSTRDR